MTCGSACPTRPTKGPHVEAEPPHDEYRTPPFDRPLDVAFANNLPSIYTPAIELVERLLTVEGGSLVYGASNSGKTFFAIDLACAVARGTRWLGRQTESWLVVYLAAESPSSVQSRLQAYQQH